MINIINFINNIIRELSFINKDSVYFSDLANLIIVGILILVNMYYLCIHMYNYYYQHEIYIKTNIGFTILFNIIAVIIVCKTLYSANTEYINTKTKNIINQVRSDVDNLKFI